VRKRVLVGVAGVAVVSFLAATLRLFAWPSTSSVPAKADAIVLLSGGAGERLPAAQRLVLAGVAPVLVIPNGHDPAWHAANRLCDQPQPFEVVCPNPEPNTTRGEARLIGHLASQRGWGDVVVVTSRYHVTRAGVLARRCVHGKVAMVAATPRGGVVTWARHALHEWGGLASALVLDRSC
jgi:uncharacterized SAM-binding protein YcdF (DUF218 family)